MESNRLKKERYSEVKDAMKDILTEEQLEESDKAFNSVIKGHLLKEKRTE